MDKKFYAINPDGSLKWSFITAGEIISSPAIAADGTVYVGITSTKYSLYAFSAEGSLKWSYKASLPTAAIGIYSSPVIGADGVVYVGSHDRRVHAVNPDGTPLWTYATGWVVNTSPAIGPDGTLYVASTDDKLYAFGVE